MMQRELDEFRKTIWNNHRIRAQKDTLMVDGIPNHIFEIPERYGVENKSLMLFYFAFDIIKCSNRLFPNLSKF